MAEVLIDVAPVLIDDCIPSGTGTASRNGLLEGDDGMAASRQHDPVSCPSVLGPFYLDVFRFSTGQSGPRRNTMGYSRFDPAIQGRAAWNAGKTVGTKRPLTQKQIWAIRFFLDREGHLRDRALTRKTDFDCSPNGGETNQKYRWKRIVIQIEHETTLLMVAPLILKMSKSTTLATGCWQAEPSIPPRQTGAPRVAKFASSPQVNIGISLPGSNNAICDGTS
ncbi:hypothetical protein [Mesorhizobium sp. KR1-2]|uniref:hypothetical protein n=1 Tax=Mesorhizobium sp. KR1-2 TaxID=3156609 RepID=UPI0032B4BEF6